MKTPEKNKKSTISTMPKKTQKKFRKLIETDKFKENPFAKKYKKSIESEENPFLSLKEGEWGRLSNKGKIKVLEKEVKKVAKQEELRPNNPPLSKKSKYQRAPETDEEFLARFQRNLEVFETANQVKSWNRSPISQTVNLTYLFLAFIIGFSVCAIVVTPLVINSI